MVDYLNKFKLDGKRSVVCGGLGLIGRESALALAQAGSEVLVLDVDNEKGKEFEGECSNNGLKVKFSEFDVTGNDFSSRIKEIWKDNGGFDIWINLAYPRTSDWGAKLENVPNESWIKNVDVQLNSYCLLARDVAELMKANEVKGNIITAGSIYGVVGPDFGVYSGTEMTMPAAYSVIKGGIINYSRYLATYYGGDGIRVNCICPGGVFNNQDSEFVQRYSERTPLGRMAKPEEIASALLFLASDASSYVHGETFLVDGGWTSK